MTFLNNISVASRITALFIIFMLFFALFGIFTLKEMQTLGHLTRTMYAHPLQVTKASLEAKSGVLKMHRGMKDLTMATTTIGVNIAIQIVQDEEKAVYRNLDIVKRQILGTDGEKLIKKTTEMFTDWQPIRGEVEELVQNDARDAAASITRHKGADYVIKLERQMDELTDYARSKADGFMAAADATRQKTVRMVIAIFCIVAVVCLFLSVVVILSIIKSLRLLKDQMAIITSTGVMKHVEVLGNNEIATLASHFNSLVSAIKDQFELRSNIEKLNMALVEDISFDEMTDKCISIISRSMSACAGALYLFNNKTRTCNLASSYALIERNHFARSFSLGEGVIGQVALEKKAISLKNISVTDACTVTGTLAEPPIGIYVVPVLYNMRLLAVMEVASLEPINDVKKHFIDEATDAIASILNNALQRQKIKTLFAEAMDTNDAIQSKSFEISTKNAALKSINKELMAQAQELQAQRDELQTQAKELETQRIQVEEADRLKTEFLSNMSHELRTPLNSIMSLSQLLISRGVDKNPKQSKEYLRVIDRNGQQLLSLINDILDLTKIESGRMDIFPTNFDIKELLKEIQDTINPLVLKKNLKINIDSSHSLIIFSDKEKIYQILLNCCSNAIKFTNEGTITLTVTQIDDTVVFKIHDTGIGIPAENIESIFDQFRQVDGSFTRVHEGTGLGLAISRKLATLLGGDIGVESTLGQGSTFTLRVPPYTTDFQHITNTSNEVTVPIPPPSTPKSSTTLLVIDGEEEARATLSKYLEDDGYNVTCTNNGKQGLELAMTTQPDIICLDLLLPDMDGFSVLDKLRLSPQTQDLPIIILTAKDLSPGDSQRLETVFKTFRKDKLNKDAFLYQVKAALESYDTPVINIETQPASSQILVVEDNDIASEQIATALKENGFDVVVAKDGQEGLAHVEQNIPAAIVLDLMMPKIDGFQVLEQIRSKPQTATLPVLILTAKELTAAERSHLTHNNVQQLIQKGTANRGQLVSSVKRMLAAGTKTAAQPLVTPQKETTRCILLVEDNPDNQLTISAILEEECPELLVATDGEQGVQIATEKIPNLILMDIQLPIMNGIDAIKVIRNNPLTDQIPIIVISAKAMKNDREIVLAAGANDYVSKPINPVELQDKVRRWIS
ncbi:MAG: hypothetical protein COA36_12280 [Desulfotalea sp.]|nr:MAG: hypothetical protein COA36_12280 [Desulfotalea sp.]